MFRLNRLTDYAVVVMMQMTHKPQEVHTAAQIAADTGIPQPERQSWSGPCRPYRPPRQPQEPAG